MFATVKDSVDLYRAIAYGVVRLYLGLEANATLRSCPHGECGHRVTYAGGEYYVTFSQTRNRGIVACMGPIRTRRFSFTLQGKDTAAVELSDN